MNVMQMALTARFIRAVFFCLQVACLGMVCCCPVDWVIFIQFKGHLKALDWLLGGLGMMVHDFECHIGQNRPPEAGGGQIQLCQIKIIWRYQPYCVSGVHAVALSVLI